MLKNYLGTIPFAMGGISNLFDNNKEIFPSELAPPKSKGGNNKKTK
jgi:hypothetical protein